jgi:Zn-dependent protease
VVITFGSILLHEFGHCFAARKVGGDADEVLLWPFGGLAFCQCPDYWRAHLIVAAGGPLVTLVIAGLSFVGFGYFNEHGSEALLRNPIYGMAEFYLTYWNGILLVFNLIPLYPLDGGRVFHSLAWGWFGRQGGYAWGGYGLASRLTLHVSRVTAALGIVACLYLEMQFAILLLAWAWWQAERLNEGRHY